MVIATKKGDILNNCERRIAFAINTEGINDAGFAGMISRRYWPELAHIGKTELGKTLVKKVEGIEFFALCCHSLENGWYDQKEIIKKCFDLFWLWKTKFTIFLSHILDLILNNISADSYTFITDIYIRTSNKLSYLILCLVTKGASKLLLFTISHVLISLIFIFYSQLRYR